MSSGSKFPILTHDEIEAWKSEISALRRTTRTLCERERWLLNKLDAANNLIAAKAVPRPYADEAASEANDGVS